MGTMNSQLRMFQSAQKEGDKKKNLPSWTKQEPGSVANVFNNLDKKRSVDINKKEKENRPPVEKKSTINVFRNIAPVEKKKNYKVSQNAKDFVNPEKLKVNKKYQKRVNTILGD